MGFSGWAVVSKRAKHIRVREIVFIMVTLHSFTIFQAVFCLCFPRRPKVDPRGSCCKAAHLKAGLETFADHSKKPSTRALGQLQNLPIALLSRLGRLLAEARTLREELARCGSLFQVSARSGWFEFVSRPALHQVCDRLGFN